MAWFGKDGKPTDVNPEVTGTPGDVKPPEKTAAELIAESLGNFTQQINAKFDEFGGRMTAIEESTRKPTPAAEPTETPSVFENERAAFAANIGPVAMRQLELEARVVLREIKDEYTAAGFGDMWNQFAKEISTTLENSPLVGGDGRAVRGNPDYIRNTVDMIFGRAARQKGVRFNGKDQTFFLEGANGEANGGNTNAPNDGLTDKQRRIFQRMGINPADGAKTRAKLEFVN